MSKKIYINIVVATLLLAAVFCITILHPHIKTYVMTMRIYEEVGGNRDIGKPITEYEHDSVTDDSLIITDFGAFSLGIPKDWEDQSKEESDYITYRTSGVSRESDGTLVPDGESMAFNPMGNDNSNIAILNNEAMYEDAGFSDTDIRHLINGFKKLGYGMPDSSYTTLKCAYSLTAEDYNFFIYDKSLAFAYALVPRVCSSYYSNGDTAKTYYYETVNKCVLINEQYRPDYDGKYHFMIEFYDADDLNIGYVFTMTVKNKETAYAIINSLTFRE